MNAEPNQQAQPSWRQKRGRAAANATSARSPGSKHPRKAQGAAANHAAKTGAGENQGQASLRGSYPQDSLIDMVEEDEPTGTERQLAAQVPQPIDPIAPRR